MTPLERAARALYERWIAQPDVAREAALNGPHPVWDRLSSETKAKWIGQARAVIAAIREPSEAQDLAAAECESSYVGDVYTAMIDALLASDE